MKAELCQLLGSWDFVRSYTQRSGCLNRGSFRGMEKFVALNPGTIPLLVGSGRIPLHEFLSTPPAEFFWLG